jgi:uncharacterized DUF497 family protein
VFEWEETRREQNIAQYGVDFVRAAVMFDNPVLEREDPRQFHGEKRFHALGHVEGFFMVVAWTPRGARRHIVQAWKADRDDEAIYRAIVPYAGPQDGGLQRGHGKLAGKLRPRLLAGSGAALSLPKPQAGPTSSRS